jgi:2-oxoglutarate/2-oxoacid ferredoxin oxidoreductase subunit beta
VVTGDGDALSIGGNHLIHAMRRNVDFKIMLFNNRIYGLTKGQYSPTSEIGKVTKSTPMGSIDAPFHPLSVALGAECTFVARCFDTDAKLMQRVLTQAHQHKGTAFIEIYQNCNVFNDGAYDHLSGKDVRAEMVLELEHGEPMLFGAARDKGIVMRDCTLQVAKVGQDCALEEVLVHDAYRADPGLAFLLSRLNLPTPVGVLRAVQKSTYDGMFQEQMQSAKAGKGGKPDLDALLRSGDTWRVE